MLLHPLRYVYAEYPVLEIHLVELVSETLRLLSGLMILLIVIALKTLAVALWTRTALSTITTFGTRTAFSTLGTRTTLTLYISLGLRDEYTMREFVLTSLGINLQTGMISTKQP